MENPTSGKPFLVAKRSSLSGHKRTRLRKESACRPSVSKSQEGKYSRRTPNHCLLSQADCRFSTDDLGPGP